EQQLIDNLNPFSLVVLAVLMVLKTKEMNDEVLLEMKRNLLVLMLQRKFSKKKRNGVFNFIKYYVDFENPDMMRIFEEEVEQLAGRNKTMGIEQYLLEREKQRGLQKGKLEGKLEGEHEKAIAIAREMKKEGIPAAQISKFTKLSEEEIKKL